MVRFSRRSFMQTALRRLGELAEPIQREDQRLATYGEMRPC